MLSTDDCDVIWRARQQPGNKKPFPRLGRTTKYDTEVILAAQLRIASLQGRGPLRGRPCQDKEEVKA